MKLRHVAMPIVSLAAASGFVVVASATPASAAEVRPGAQAGQIDVLLDDWETQQAATSLWGTGVVCVQIGGAFGATAAGVGLFAEVGAAALGVAGATATMAPCLGLTAVCAAQAYVDGRRAGMTLSPTGAWCWKY